MSFLKKIALLFKSGADKTRSSIKLSFEDGVKKAKRNGIKSKQEILMQALDNSLILRFRMMGKPLNQELIVTETLSFLQMPIDLAKKVVAEYVVYHHHPSKVDLDWLQTEFSHAYQQAQENAPSKAVTVMENNRYQTKWSKIVNRMPEEL